jgi:hypothetical protein
MNNNKLQNSKLCQTNLKHLDIHILNICSSVEHSNTPMLKRLNIQSNDVTQKLLIGKRKNFWFQNSLL